MEVITDYAEVDDSWSFYSLLSIAGKAGGICITGSKFPLENAELTSEYQYGVSNEVIPGETAKISLSSGALLLVKVY